mgnify:CR=1 FL=1
MYKRQVGDIVSYCRRARKDEVGIQWSIGSRIVGFETDPHQPDKEPSSCWVVCDGVPVCVATDKIRPCTAAELLAYQFMQGKDLAQPPVNRSAGQQSFVDERILPSKELRAEEAANAPPTKSRSTGSAASGSADRGSSSAGPSTAQSSASPVDNEGDLKILDDSDQGEESASDEDALPAEELRASPNISAVREGRGSSAARAGPYQREVPRPKSLEQHWKRTKTTGKGVEMLEKMACLFDIDDQPDPELVGFLQVRLMAPKTKKTPTRKPQKKKDGDKNLSYASCSPEIQRGLDKSRCKEWQTLKKFNAGVLLPKAEVAALQNEGVKVYPMQWIETDKNAHKRRDDKNVQPDLKSRLVGCGNFEDAEGFRTDSPTGDVDAHNLVFSWCASSKVKIKSADISGAYLQGKQNDRIILYRIPKGGIPCLLYTSPSPRD